MGFLGLNLILVTSVLYAPAAAVPQKQDLKLLLSLEETALAAPFPARATLHFHNAAEQSLWLYRRVGSRTEDGSSLEVRFEPLEMSSQREVATPAAGQLLDYAGLPRPRLEKIPPGEDATERVTLKLQPAKTGEGDGIPVWGRYRLTVIYRAAYSNAASVKRETNAALWEGEVASNAVEIELKPPDGDGTVTGSIFSAQGRSLDGMVATLSREDEQPVDQTVTGADGRFAFGPLPLGLYWVTVRRANATENTTVFRHVTLTAEEPSGSIEFVMYPPETYEPRNILHKPVILLVTDNQGMPLDKVSYQIVWSNGIVVDNERGEVDRDGTATFELIPGRNYVTLRRRGCPKQEDRMDISQGGGVDGFRLVLTCSKE